MQEMFIAAVAISSFILLSSAQPDQECAEAYDAVFNANTTCAEAYNAVFYGNATDEQRMMVCDADQQCNAMIESIISTCGNMVSLLHSSVESAAHPCMSTSVNRELYASI